MAIPMLKNLGITYYNPVSTSLFTNVTSYMYKLIVAQLVNTPTVQKIPQLVCVNNPALSTLYPIHLTCWNAF